MRALALEMGRGGCMWVILKVMAFADGVRKKRVKDFRVPER